VDLGDLFNDANTGKRSLTLDLTSDRGRDLIRDLIAKSDVVVNNYTAGKLDAMGFPYEELRNLNPKLVLIHLPGVGGDSPWVSHRTLGNLLMAASGQNFLMGFPDRPPRGMGIAYPDFTSPHLLVASALAALREAERSGEGREIQLSQLSATVSLLGAEWMRFAQTGQQPPRPANRDPNYCPHGVYPTRGDPNDGDDQWIALAVASDDEWSMLAGLMGDAAPSDPALYATDAGRRANEDHLDASLAAWTATQDRWALAALLQTAGIAAAPVENLRDMIETDPQMRDHYQRIRQPSDPDFEITIDGEPIRLAGQDRVLERAPTLGEHNEYVLREILGLSQQEFDTLVADGVVA
jgi:crotonobetainyl-CoA:carnitine CoA-transferase CaiB-like acyl-CoA transferase